LSTSPHALDSETQAPGRRFLVVYGATLFSFALLTCVLVTLSDPNRYFFGGPVPQILVNTRRDKVDLFKAYSKKAKVSGLIFGSSRAGLFRPELVDQRSGLRFFNASVDTGTIDDYLAIYRLFSDLQSMPPREILIGVDTLYLSSQIPLEFGLSANYDLARHLDQNTNLLFHYAELYQHYFRLQTFVDFKESWDSWKRRGELHSRYEYDPDGRWRLATEDREIAKGTYNRGAALRTSTEVFLSQYRDFTSVSQLRMERLESLLREASRDGAHIVMWFTPMHPALRDRVEQLTGVTPIEHSAKEAVIQLGRRYGAPVVDLSQPESFGADPSTWYDSVHLSQADADRELERLLPYVKARQ
jgi:hypothetical protein